MTHNIDIETVDFKLEPQFTVIENQKTDHTWAAIVN